MMSRFLNPFRFRYTWDDMSMMVGASVAAAQFM